jgi:hypothetical protein
MSAKFFEIKPKLFLVNNLKIIILLITFHITFQVADYFFDNIPSFPDERIYKLFNLDAERNIPTAYAGIMILFSSIILFLISFYEENKKNKFYFKILSGIFFLLCWDELFSIHEVFSYLFIKLVDTSDYFFHPWVVPYFFLTLIVFSYFFKFVLKFPMKIRNLIFLAGFIYILGEMIFETLGGKWMAIHGYPHLMTKPQFFLNFAFITLEESLGLVGILIFNYALLRLLQTKVRKILILAKS